MYFLGFFHGVLFLLPYLYGITGERDGIEILHQSGICPEMVNVKVYCKNSNFIRKLMGKIPICWWKFPYFEVILYSFFFQKLKPA